MQMNPSVTIERKRVDCAALPKGWQREEVLRKSGISAGSGKVDVYYYSRALRTDVSLVPPIRQTASIFKQPVTVIRNHEPSKVKHDAKHGGQEKPKQLFWEKRLERLRACHDTGEELDDITLPKTIRTVGPNVNEQTVLQSVATALHVLNAGVHGQTSAKADLTKNAMAFMNPEQPLMHAVIISEDDIRKQEDRVSVARRKLQDALKT
ncbi:methyl-CpG-binding domain protein 2 isoform X2 [Scaptodrosophila lebanonensis]|uniref:Methyl-CpG-binding domain protein 2 isoform X2 n=1 Tax=Drosophila lebanonensis TaxID=7225 RepID=A0A6J2TCJ2_DROLE|nr:methyl-CpG-binding domain protein 2 isoform X2 [Scaptodrosophila lebanonensis]